MPLLTLAPVRQNTFRRTVGKRVIEFPPRVAVEVTAGELKKLEPDIGSALLPCTVDAKGRPRLVKPTPTPPSPAPAAKTAAKPAD